MTLPESEPTEGGPSMLSAHSVSILDVAGCTATGAVRGVTATLALLKLLS